MTKITDTDILNLKKLMQPGYDFYFRDYHIENACRLYQQSQNIEDLKSILDAYRVKGLDKMYQYLNDSCTIDVFTRLDDKKNTNRNSDFLDFYVKLVCGKKHTIEDDKKNKIIDDTYINNQKDFKNLLRLSLSVQNNTIESFLKVLEKKNGRTPDALKSIEIEELYKKKFSPLEQVQYIDRLHNALPTLKKESFMQETEGYFYKMTIDTDKLSSFNLLDAQTNYVNLKSFSDCFSQYILKNNELNILSVSLDKDALNYRLHHLTFVFESPENKKETLKELLNHFIQNTISRDNAENFFNSFLMEKKLNCDLTDKKTNKTKKI